MAWNFTRLSLKNAIREAVGQKAINLTDENGLIDRAVRMVGRELDLRSAKRRAQLSPRLTSKYDYAAPTNLKGWAVIDVQRNVNRPTRQSSEWQLTTPEEFDRLKTVYPNLMTVTEYDNQKFVRLSGIENDDAMVIHSMDGTTSNGTWTADSDGGSANNLDTSSNDDFTGSANLVWDVNTDTTTADIQNSTMTAVDITSFKRDGGYIFVRQYIPLTSASELAKITSFRLQIGSDSGNYYQDTATTANGGLTFTTGLNELRFNFRTTATAGTPSDTAIDYVKLQLVLSSVLASASLGWRTDAIVARQGKIHNLHYYTDYLWDSGTLQTSANDTNTLMAYEQEFDLFVEKGTQLAAKAVGDRERSIDAKNDYKELKRDYELQHPSEAKIIQTTYHYLPDSTEDTRNADFNDTSA